MSDQANAGLVSPFLQRKRIDRALPFLRGRILDFGCGNGAVLERLEPAQRASYLGYDPDPSVISIARRRFPSASFTARAGDLEGRRFDSVASLAVIEHVPSVAGYLETLQSMLAEGGVAVLTSPRRSTGLVYRAGAALGLFSREASAEHNEYVTEPALVAYCSKLELELQLFKPFLLGANQLFVLRRRASARPRPRRPNAPVRDSRSAARYSRRRR